VRQREISIAFQTDKSVARYIALAQFVNQYDFDAVSVYNDAPYHPGYAALLLMAPHIQRARLGVAATAPTRVHPIDIAAQAALLSEMATAGTYIGFARGAWLRDHAVPEPQPPIQTIREAVEVVRYLLSGASGGYQGRVYQLAEHVRAPYPLPDKLPPILIGSWGHRLCALAGEIADEVKIGGSTNPDVVPVIASSVAEGERQAGRTQGTVGLVVGAVTVVDEDREAARMAARRAAALYLPVVAGLDPTVSLEPELVERLRQHVNRGQLDVASGLISDDLLDRFAFSGDADDLIRQAESLFAAGASRLEFGTPHGLVSETGIRIIGEKVIPALRI
jgi:5,10-methylenetetrahydromethanopterin reductase